MGLIAGQVSQRTTSMFKLLYINFVDDSVNVIFAVLQVKSVSNKIAMKNKVSNSVQKTNQKGAGTLAQIIPDWPQLKSFDKTKERKKVFTG